VGNVQGELTDGQEQVDLGRPGSPPAAEPVTDCPVGQTRWLCASALTLARIAIAPIA
jgi:hypothetical protein